MDPVNFLTHTSRLRADTPKSADAFYAENGCEGLLRLRRVLAGFRTAGRAATAGLRDALADHRGGPGIVPGRLRG